MISHAIHSFKTKSCNKSCDLFSLLLCGGFFTIIVEMQ